MKRIAIVCLLLITCVVVSAQREPRYKYNYTFNIDLHTCPTNTLKDTLLATPGGSSFEIELKDCNNNGIPFVTATIRGRDSLAKSYLTDSAGKVTFTTLPGNYNITIASIGFQGLTKRISISNDSQHYLVITLAYAQSMDIYDIRSKIPLSAKKIEEIKACVEQNPSNPFKCSVKNTYSISMEI